MTMATTPAHGAHDAPAETGDTQALREEILHEEALRQEALGHLAHEWPTDHAQPPLRWPHPDRTTLLLVGTWVLGVLTALFVPALVVAPGATSAPSDKVWLAFSITVVGALVMFACSVGLWRRSRESAVLVMGTVPSLTCLAGGVIMAATKLTA